MSPTVARPRSLTLPLLAVALLFALAVLAFQMSRAPSAGLRLPLYDYTAFWAAGRLTLAGEDPYDPARLAVLQKQADPNQGDTLVMWPAPWALTLLLPVSDVDAHRSHVFWLVLEMLVLLAAVYGAWRIYGGQPNDVWLAGVVTFTFLPVYMVLVTAQMAPWMLLGFVGFLWFLKRGHDGLAGAALVLAAIKPQLTLLFWLVLLLWAVHQGRWRLLAGGIIGTAAALAWPLWHNPHLLHDYWVAISQRTQTHSHVSPLLGTALRLTLAPDRFWLQFAPLVPGAIWAAWHWWRYRRDWNWPERLPRLLFASFVVAPYGAWPFDLVVLLLPLLQRVVQLEAASRRQIGIAAVGFGLVSVLALGQLLHEIEYFWFLWLTPALWLIWALSAPSTRELHVVHPELQHVCL